jgi:TonB family protein
MEEHREMQGFVPPRPISRGAGIGLAAIGLFISAAALFLSAAWASPQAAFKPPEVVSATDTIYPIQSVADGVVVFDLSLNESGEISGSQTLRDVASLTAPASSAVQSWKFKPASRGAMPQASSMTVAFVYRPPVSLWKPPDFSPAAPQPDSSAAGYVPPGILAVGYAQYPVNSVASGAVVVQVTVDEKGGIGRVKVVRPMPGFTSFALAAVKKWRFQPALLGGLPVASNVAIAFVFAAPSGNQ